jgi:hypothetical protein
MLGMAQMIATLPALARQQMSAQKGAKKTGTVMIDVLTALYDAQERWTFGFLFDIILTRDPFMHRLDISRATGIPVHAAPAHEGVIVNDIVHEWAARHGRPYTLSLSGPAGGTWGGEGENITKDAFDFCRTVSGREPATGLLGQQVPF